MDYIEELLARHMLGQVTHQEQLQQHLATGVRTGYTGFDPTATSLHVGHLVPIMALRRLQQHGHRVLAVIGGGTVMIGDPSGRSEMRQLVDAGVIEERKQRLQQQLSRFLDLSHSDRGMVLDNIQWLQDLNYIGFLRDIGSHFSVNRMLAAECFKSRLAQEQGLSFLEFNYMLLQSFDFYHLHQNFQCSLQVGGDDQWSNMLGGMDLIRRKSRQDSFCVTVPLLATASGAKMGKTAAGAVWLDPALTSVFDFYQYFRNVPDDRVRMCLDFLSDLTPEDIQQRCEELPINQLKAEMALQVTTVVHGAEEANIAHKQAQQLFADSGLTAKRQEAPEIVVTGLQVQGDEVAVIDLLLSSGIVTSKSEARRLLQQGGVVIDGKKVSDIDAMLPLQRLQSPEGLLLQKGKKKFFTLRF